MSERCVILIVNGDVNTLEQTDTEQTYILVTDRQSQLGEKRQFLESFPVVTLEHSHGLLPFVCELLQVVASQPASQGDLFLLPRSHHQLLPMASAQELPISGEALKGCSLCRLEALESSSKHYDDQMVNYESSSNAEDEMDSIHLSDSSSNSEDGVDDFTFVNLFSDSEDEVDFVNMPWDGAMMNKPEDPWMILLEAGELIELKDEDETFLWVRYITTCWTRTSAALIQCIKLVPK